MQHDNITQTNKPVLPLHLKAKLMVNFIYQSFFYHHFWKGYWQFTPFCTCLTRWYNINTAVTLQKAGCDVRESEGGRGLFTHGESTLDIPGMSEDCQIRPDGMEALPQRDQAGMRAGYGGTKASDWPMERSCQSEREKRASFLWIKKTTVRSLGGGCWRHRFVRMVETVHSQASSLRPKNKTSYLFRSWVSEQSQEISRVNRELIKGWTVDAWYVQEEHMGWYWPAACFHGQYLTTSQRYTGSRGSQ